MFSESAIIKKISTLIKYLCKANTKGIIAILAYHGISEREEKNCVSVEKFILHLEFVRQNFHIVKLSDLLNFIQIESENKKNIVAITFDDAYQNFYQFAYPELKERNIPAALFVPAGLVGGYNCWDYNHRKHYPYLKIMNWEELKELDSKLIEIGSHGYSHRRMACLREDELKIEIIKSKELLESELNREIDTFAYPYGTLSSFDRRTVKILKDSGYRFALSTHFGREKKPSDLYSLKRIGIWDDDQVNDIGDKLAGYYDWLGVKGRMAYYLRKLLMIK